MENNEQAVRLFGFYFKALNANSFSDNIFKTRLHYFYKTIW